jgi:hypothetical protein
MSVHAKLEAPDRRFSPRKRLRLGSVSTSLKEDVLIHDISSTGLLLETGAELETFDTLDVELPEVGPTEAVVVWTSGRYFGCQFAESIPKAVVSASLLRSPAGDASARVAFLREPAVDGEEEVADDGELSFGTKIRIILVMSLTLWALILWMVGIL